MKFQLENMLMEQQADFFRVVPFDPENEKLSALDISKNNAAFDETVFRDTDTFSAYINEKLAAQQAKYLIGGYREHRVMYSRSSLFDKNLSSDESKIEEPRCIHLHRRQQAYRRAVGLPAAHRGHSRRHSRQWGDPLRGGAWRASASRCGAWRS